MTMFRRHLFHLLILIPLILLVCCGQRTRSNALPKNQTDSANYLTDTVLRDIIPPDSLASKDYLLGQFNPAIHPLFQQIDSKHTTIKEGYLRKEALDAFIAMHHAALQEGITLKIVSATRNFQAQKGIWEAKWNGARKVDGIDLTTVKDPVVRASMILKYSSMPGTSRHHWGTDIDINSVDPDYFLTPKGIREYEWLNANARDYGFCQTYTKKDSLRQGGYEEEPWHWSFTPVSSVLLKRYTQTITYGDLKGFKGDHTAETLQVIRVYVKGINAACQ
jgi:zinc D-Ala-D-Ala carboxypeptidase